MKTDTSTARATEGLQGSLDRTPLVALLHTLHRDGRTGELEVLSGRDGGRAVAYFTRGQLSHVAAGNQVGLDALAGLVGREHGTYRFSPDVLCSKVTIDLPFQEAILAAVGRHNEPDVVEPEQENAAVLEEMRRFLAGNPSAVDAGLIAADGHIVVCGGEGEVPPWLENISRLVPGLVANHTRAPLQRMVFEADHGSVVVVFLPDGSALLIAADQQATLGAVASAADRLARTIQQLGSPEKGLSPD